MPLVLSHVLGALLPHSILLRRVLVLGVAPRRSGVLASVIWLVVWWAPHLTGALLVALELVSANYCTIFNYRIYLLVELVKYSLRL